jgi:sarcosine oxidase, subunit beta
MTKHTFDIAIVGGGVYGAACAWYLSQNHKNVLLIEKNRVGTSGATGISRGIVRVYDPDEDLASISLEGALHHLHWEKLGYPGLNPYTASGFVYLFDKKNEAQMANAIQRYATPDYPMELLSADSIARRFPWLAAGGDKMAIYEKYGGYGDPRLTALSFLSGFRNNGGAVYENCAVTRIEATGETDWKLHLPNGAVSAKVVLLAAGGHSRKLFPELPVFTRSISLAQVQPASPQVTMTVVDEVVETYFRPGDGSSFYCGSQVFETVDTPDDLQTAQLDIVTDAVARAGKVLQTPIAGNVINHFHGHDCYTESKRPITQFVSGLNGLYVATGFSGRGYKCVTAIGQYIAKEISHYLGTPVRTTSNNEWRIKW